MLSIRRLAWIVIITSCISAAFLMINFHKSSYEEVKVINEQFQMDEIVEAEETEETNSSLEDRFILITSETDNRVYENISELFKDWKMPCRTLSRVETFDETKESIYIFCEDEIIKTADLEQLASYIEQGGIVIFANGIAEGNTETYLNPVLGIISKSNKLPCSQFTLAEEFLPYQEEKMTYDGYNASTWIQLNEKAKIYVSDTEKKEAVIYSYPYGKGKSLVINGTFMEDINCQGMLAGLLSNEIQGFTYPILNTKLIYLDNYPVVTYADDEICLRLYGRKTDDFVENVIWPVFQGIAVQNEIKYTSSVLTYGMDNTVFTEMEDSLFYTMGKSALMYEGELVEAADFSQGGSVVENQFFKDKFKRFFPEYQIHSLAVLSGKYTDYNSLNQEIAVVRGYMEGDEENMTLCKPQYQEGIYYFPVVTDGLELEQGNMFRIAMQTAARGILSQRIDVNTLIYDKDENASWDHIKILLSDYQKDVISPLFWMHAVTLSETANNINGYEKLKYDTDVSADGIRITCSTYRPGQAFILHSEKAIRDAEGANIEKINTNYYLVEITGEHAELRY